jgi:hypothetical protein
MATLERACTSVWEAVHEAASPQIAFQYLALSREKRSLCRATRARRAGHAAHAKRFGQGEPHFSAQSRG